MAIPLKKRKTFHAAMLVTRAEEWCVEAETAEEARELLASGIGHRFGLAAVLAIVYLYLARQKEARCRQLAAVSEVAREQSRTTWKINAVADLAVMEHQKDDIPSKFYVAHRGEPRNA